MFRVTSNRCWNTQLLQLLHTGPLDPRLVVEAAIKFGRTSNDIFISLFRRWTELGGAKENLGQTSEEIYASSMQNSQPSVNLWY